MFQVASRHWQQGHLMPHCPQAPLPPGLQPVVDYSAPENIAQPADFRWVIHVQLHEQFVAAGIPIERHGLAIEGGSRGTGWCGATEVLCTRLGATPTHSHWELAHGGTHQHRQVHKGTRLDQTCRVDQLLLGIYGGGLLCTITWMGVVASVPSTPQN